QLSHFSVIVVCYQRRSFLLKRVKLLPAGMKSEVARPVAGRQRYAGRIGLREFARLHIELPNEDLVQSKIARQDELTRGISLNHGCVRLIMGADRAGVSALVIGDLVR